VIVVFTVTAANSNLRRAVRHRVRHLATDLLTGSAGRLAGFMLDLVMEGGAQLRASVAARRGRR
jgi:hypothetical protein